MKINIFLVIPFIALLSDCSINSNQSMDYSRDLPTNDARIAQQLKVEAIAMIDGKAFELEVARTPQQQTIGLMNRQHLAKNRGMLFPVNPPREVSLWMRQTLIPLDMIFLKNGKIVNIHRSTQPCQSQQCKTYSSSGMVDAVIEVAGGTASKLNLKAGESISIQFLEPDKTPKNEVL